MRCRNVGNIPMGGYRKFRARRRDERRARCSRGYPFALRVCAAHSRRHSILVFRGVLRALSELRGLRDRHRVPGAMFLSQKRGGAFHESQSIPQLRNVSRAR